MADIARVACIVAALVGTFAVLGTAGRELHQAGATPPVSQAPNYARAGCDNFTQLSTWSPLRPGYHISAPYGWINDPHGMFYLDGRHHLFFQYNPEALHWGPPYWGHVVSNDSVHWTWVQPALLPNQSLTDQMGCWSGGATVTPQNVPMLTYTSSGTQVPEMGIAFQTQSMAYPANMSDPLLRDWTKSPTNPFITQVPMGGTNFQFRDPTEARHGVWLAVTNTSNPNALPQSWYALAVGGQVDCLGSAIMYAAPNMTGPWYQIGLLFSQLDLEPGLAGQCESGNTATNATLGPAYGGPCNQFGARCRTWEVVDFAELAPGLFMLKWSDQSRSRGEFAIEWYVLGNAPWDYAAIKPPPGQETCAANAAGRTEATRNESVLGQATSTYPNTTTNLTIDYNATGAHNYQNVSNTAHSLFQASLDGQRFAPQRLDYGSTYASMIYRDEKMRQLMYSWVYETAAGCKDQCSDQYPPVVVKNGFKGVETLPRQLTYDNETRSLRAFPIPEVETLRAQMLANESGSLPVGGSIALVNESSISNTNNTRARQLEVRITFLLPDSTSSGTVSMGLTLLTGNRTSVGVYLSVQVGNPQAGAAANMSGNASSSGNATGGQGSPMITGVSVYVNRSLAGGETNTTWVEGGPVILPPGGLPLSTRLHLDAWIDHSLLEVFALNGLGRVTSRIYPAGDDVSWGVNVFAQPYGSGGAAQDVAVDARVWELENAWQGEACSAAAS